MGREILVPHSQHPWRNCLLGAIYLLVVSLVLWGLLYTYSYDDPFITYRYAHNLGNGLGFVYNPGERVLSTTTPLFTLLLAPFAALGFNLHPFAILLGAFSLPLGGLLLWDLSRTWQTPWVGRAGLLLYPTFPLVLGTLSSETPLYLALCLAAFAAYARRRYSLTALACALATLARPDGILVPAILAAHFAFAERSNVQTFQRSNVLRPVIVFTAILLAWVIPAWLYFGSPIPVTLAAKQSQGVMDVSQKFAGGLLTILQPYFFWPYLLEALLMALGFLTLLWKKHFWLLFIAWPVLYFAAYSLLGVSRYFWYYAPLVPGFVVLVGLGVEMVAGRKSKVEGRRSKAEGRTRDLRLLTFDLAATVLLMILFVAQGRDVWTMRSNTDRRYAIYRAAGEWLTRNTPPDARVGTLEVGIIGYFAQRPLIDFAGLIQPDVARQMRVSTTYDDTALWALKRYQPEYVAVFEETMPRLSVEYLSVYCLPVQTFAAAPFNSPYALIIYQCRPFSR
jgi:hypothetical protein